MPLSGYDFSQNSENHARRANFASGSRIKKEQDGALKNVKNGTPCKWIFTGTKRHVPLSNMAMLALLRRMNRRDITVHGFRSTFRDWAAEQTNYPREVAEAALAHAVGDKVEAAYRRSDLFDKRRQMMDAWDRYCAPPQAPTGRKIVNIGR